MTPTNEKRQLPQSEGTGALAIAGRRITVDGTPGAAEPLAPCPVACSPSCSYRCPIALGDAVLELVAELVVRS